MKNNLILKMIVLGVISLALLALFTGGCKKEPEPGPAKLLPPPPPKNVTDCVDFSGIAVGTEYPMGYVLIVKGVQFDIKYNTGGRIKERPNYITGTHFLELSGAGKTDKINIRLPVKASAVIIDVLQGGPDPINITCNSFTTSTTMPDIIERFNFIGTDIETISMTGSETYIYRMCWLANSP